MIAVGHYCKAHNAQTHTNTHRWCQRLKTADAIRTFFRDQYGENLCM